MKTIILYSSYFHKNTLKVAKIMSEVLDADLIKVSEANPLIINEYDIIGFGSGIYFFKAHKNMLKYLEELSSYEGKKAFVFSTSGLGLKIFNKAVVNLLKDKNFEIIGNFSCKGFDTYGPAKLIGGINKGRPNEQDLKQAKDFAEGIKQLT